MMDSSVSEYGADMDSTNDNKARIKRILSELSDIDEMIHQLTVRRKQLAAEMTSLNASAREASLGRSRKLHGDERTAFQSRDNFPWSQSLKQELKNSFGFDKLRDNQLGVVNATMSKRNVFVVMKTGGGKSLCYQLPALLEEGITLVVSPLVSLIRDQVRAMNAIHANTASAFSGKIDVTLQRQICKAMASMESPLRLVYVTPEKVHSSKLLMTSLQAAFDQGRLTRIVIDEAHCCSQWGHDFRPDYAKLGILRKLFPSVPVLCLTATASSTVRQDVIKILSLQGDVHHADLFNNDCYSGDDEVQLLGSPAAHQPSPTSLPPVVFLGDFNRPNLHYAVWAKSNDFEHDVGLVAQALGEASTAAIVYCFTQRETEKVAESLQRCGYRAACYHAGMETEDRDIVQDDWTAGHIQVICATIAFGLGINKPDVRLVIHFTMSKSVDLYYQESGRASRDGLPGSCILLYHPEDALRIASVAVNDLELLPNGTTRHKVMSMIEYCQQSAGKCRRQLFAEALRAENIVSSESATSSSSRLGSRSQRQCDSECNRCDVCQPTELSLASSSNLNPSSAMAISNEVLAVIFQAVANAESVSTDGKNLLTAKKVLEAKEVKRATKMAKISPWGAAWAINAMLCCDVLGIKLHFTPYSTICYLTTRSSSSRIADVAHRFHAAPSIAFLSNEQQIQKTSQVSKAFPARTNDTAVKKVKIHSVLEGESEDDFATDSDLEIIEQPPKKKAK